MIRDANREPHPTDAYEVVVVMIEVKTSNAHYDLRMRVSLKTGFPLPRLRIHSGETPEFLRSEVRDKGRQITFNLCTVVGRKVVVQVADDEYEGHKYTRISTIDPDSSRFLTQSGLYAAHSLRS